MRYAMLITLFIFATAGNVWGQPKRKPTRTKPAQTQILNFDEADALFGKRKRTAPRKAHDKYANQEVSYRKAGRKAKAPAAVFEPNNEPLWAKQRAQPNPQRKAVSQRAKNQDIEVENDETHRTKSRAARTESVSKDETARTKNHPRRRNN